MVAFSSTNHTSLFLVAFHLLANFRFSIQQITMSCTGISQMDHTINKDSCCYRLHDALRKESSDMRTNGRYPSDTRMKGEQSERIPWRPHGAEKTERRKQPRWQRGHIKNH
ncbi:hypothetical protein C8J56DRAFT_519679 [Mycena floridula]|nr:hypothetical protein C8J56DRAFT_519679 [Mycena floridula]